MDALVALKTRTADALTLRGTQHVLAGNALPAWEDLSRAVALDPDDIAARVNLGALLESKGRCQKPWGSTVGPCDRRRRSRTIASRASTWLWRVTTVTDSSRDAVLRPVPRADSPAALVDSPAA